MIAKIADLIKAEIETLEFVDRIAGLVRSLPITVPAEDGTSIRNMPVALSDGLECEPQDMMYLVPDSSKMSVIFFEDGGTTIERRDSWYVHCRSTLRLVAWFNLKMINPDYTDATLLMAHLLAAIPKYIDNDDLIKRILVIPQGELPKDTVYSNYDLDLAHNLYFAFPYDYAAFDIDVVYAIAKNCLDEIVIDPNIC